MLRGLRQDNSATVVVKKKAYPKKRKMSISDDVRHLKVDVRKLKSELEMKWTDSYTAATIPATGGSPQGLLALCNNVAIGSNAGLRIGTEIVCTKLELRTSFATGVTLLTDYPLQTRLIIFWDKQPNGGIPVLYLSGTGGNQFGLLDNSIITPVTLAPLNRNAEQRYKVLYDEYYVIDTSGAAGTFGLDARTITLPLSRKTKFNNNGNSLITDFVSNALWVAVFNDSGNNNAFGEIATRVHFHDS